MSDLTQDLLALIAQLRQEARQSRAAAQDIPNMTGKGHLYGISDGFEDVAIRIELLLAKDRASE